MTGGKTEGDYCFTLDLTDVATGWTELAAVPIKPKNGSLKRSQDLRRRLPFTVLGLDSDNGSGIHQTTLPTLQGADTSHSPAAAPGGKTTICYVEPKNWSVVRRYVGYSDCETSVRLRTAQRFTGFYVITSTSPSFDETQGKRP